MTNRVGVCLAASVWVCASVFASGCGEPAPPPPPFKPVADVKLLMSGVVDPSADGVWASVAIDITAAGEAHKKPTTDEEWAVVRNHALMLAESGNLLMMAPRARDNGDWMAFSLKLTDAAAEALDATIKKDADKLLLVGGLIYDACASCHKKYVPGGARILGPPISGNASPNESKTLFKFNANWTAARTAIIRSAPGLLVARHSTACCWSRLRGVRGLRWRNRFLLSRTVACAG